MDDLKFFRQQMLAGVLLAATAIALWALFSQAEGLTWGFDDELNLKGLAAVSSPGELINFITGGQAGPTGRPVSLLAFVPNYADWPSNPFGFVQTTLIWHILNTFLVFILFRRLLVHCGMQAKANWMAALGAAFWALLPIHASSILLPVQRMTHVSAFFSLLALNLFVAWRGLDLIRQRPWLTVLALAAITAALVLSIYAKENGVITVAYLALIELFFFRGSRPPLWRPLWILGVCAGLLLVPAYLAYETVRRFDVILSGVVWHREFNYLQRLATEPVILWEYLRMTLLPRISAMGPFHDDYPVLDWSQPLPWLALAGWICIILAALRWARSGQLLGRLALFAVAFFLMGHLLESTVIMLELYFEHRNYLPVLGLVLWGMVAVDRLARRLKGKWAPWLIVLLCLGFNLFSLQQLTALWGQPLMAAELWYRYHPDSTRAVQALARQYAENGFYDAAQRLLDEFSRDVSSGRVDVGIQAAVLACGMESREQMRQRVRVLRSQLAYIARPAGMVAGLGAFGSHIRADKCSGLSLEEYEALLRQMSQISRIANTHQVVHHVYYEMALTSKKLGDMEDYFMQAKAAYRAYPSLSLGQLVAAELFREGRDNEAIVWLDEAIGLVPQGLSGLAWRKSMTSLKEAILKTQAAKRAFMTNS